LLAAEKKLLKRRKIALCLGQVSRLQILPGLFKALFKLLLVRMLSGGGTNPTENCAGNSPNAHIGFLSSGGPDWYVVSSEASPEE